MKITALFLFVQKDLMGASNDTDEELVFYGNLVHETLCILKCRNSTVKEPNIFTPKDVLDDMDKKLPYDYLQLCYYQVSNGLMVMATSGEKRYGATAAEWSWHKAGNLRVGVQTTATPSNL